MSLYPKHEKTLSRLALDMNMAPSVAIQILLELEDRQELVRKEMVRRLAIAEAA